MFKRISSTYPSHKNVVVVKISNELSGNSSPTHLGAKQRKNNSGVIRKLCSHIIRKLCSHIIRKLCSHIIRKLCSHIIRKLCSHIIIRLGETPDRVSSLLEERCVCPVGGRGSIPRGGFPHTHTEREGRGETTNEDSSEMLGYSTIRKMSRSHDGKKGQNSKCGTRSGRGGFPHTHTNHPFLHSS
jgi:hypothetical protein